MNRQRRNIALCVNLLLVASGVLAVHAQATTAEWLTLQFSELVDRRQLSHSGESVAELLSKLQGRGVPATGQRPDDRLAHSLLQPLIEPYAFVLSDALDQIDGVPEIPFIEIAQLWRPGQAQPAWVELLRSRRIVAESDGAGSLRFVLPYSGTARTSAQAAQQTWEQHWSILRHVIAAELARQGAQGESAGVDVQVHAYRHAPENTEFVLGRRGYEIRVTDGKPAGRQPPLELEQWQAFLDSGLTLQGGLIDAEGAVRLLGSPGKQPPQMLGRPLALSDLAVAYRAVFHGGLAEPYMSLDRGYSPQISVVNYGGRLRDTALGWVSLLCDIRFKTFSQGLDIVEGTDMRPRLREALPNFRSHVEAFAADPSSEGVMSQQTRLWFYPDQVDLTLSQQADALVMRRVRMSAASERVGEEGTATRGEDPPWTRATVAAINRDYDTLSQFFPELADLDQVVRLLSLFTWLRQAQSAGVQLPELDALLALELPQLTTPRTFPQLLAFNALPAAGTNNEAAVIDRVGVAEALQRLNPASGRPYPARLRLERALAGLDPREPQAAALLERFSGTDFAQLNDGALDRMAYQAERVRMHLTVLASLTAEEQAELAAREQRGETLRVFSVGIGGLDLGMGQALARSSSQALGLAGAGGASTRSTNGGPRRSSDPSAGQVVEAWRTDASQVAQVALPDHGLSATDPHSHRVTLSKPPQAGGTGSVRTVYGEFGPDAVSRRIELDAQRRPRSFTRTEGSFHVTYRFETQGERWTARSIAAPSPPAVQASAGRATADGLVALQIQDVLAGDAAPSPTLPVRLVASVDGTARSLEADFPRLLLQRLAMGPAADLTPSAPPPLAALPPNLGQVQVLMFELQERQHLPPWEAGQRYLAGEADATRLARSVNEFRQARGAGAPAVVGTDASRAPERWVVAPRTPLQPVLHAQGDAQGPAGMLRKAIAQAWPGKQGDPDSETDLIVVVGSEPPDLFSARLLTLAQRPEFRGAQLAIWSLAGPLRADLPRRLLETGNLAGVGVAESTVVGLRQAAERLAAFAQQLEASPPQTRLEAIPGPFLWYY